MDGALVTALIGLLAPAVGAVSGIKFVSEGERGMVLRFDKAVKRRKTTEYKVVGPGLRLLFPGVHKLARVHVRQRILDLPTQTIILSDRTVFKVSAVLVCRVKGTPDDVYSALFETTNLNKALQNVGTRVIRDVLTRKGYADMFGEEQAKIAGELIEAIRPHADQWGVEMLSFQLNDCDPDEGTTRLIQTVAQAEFRLEALTASADKLRGLDISPGLAGVLIGAPLVASGGLE